MTENRYYVGVIVLAMLLRHSCQFLLHPLTENYFVDTRTSGDGNVTTHAVTMAGKSSPFLVYSKQC